MTENDFHRLRGSLCQNSFGDHTCIGKRDHRDYPATALPLLPFKEYWKRFSMAEFERFNCSVPPGAGSLLPGNAEPASVAGGETVSHE